MICNHRRLYNLLSVFLPWAFSKNPICNYSTHKDHMCAHPKINKTWGSPCITYDCQCVALSQKYVMCYLMCMNLNLKAIWSAYVITTWHVMWRWPIGTGHVAVNETVHPNIKMTYSSIWWHITHRWSSFIILLWWFSIIFKDWNYNLHLL